MQYDNKKFIELKPYTLSQLAGIYNVSRKTFRGWLKPFQELIGKRIGYMYSIPQVKIIFSKLSYPSVLLIKNDEEENFKSPGRANPDLTK